MGNEKCPYCKEAKKEGAKKCNICGEWFDLRRYLQYCGSIATVVVALGTVVMALCTLGSLRFAYSEYQKKEKIENALNIKESILRKVPPETISKVMKEELKPKGEPRFVTVFPDEESRKKAKKIEKLIFDGNKALEAGREDEAQQSYLIAERLERTSPQIQQSPEPIVPKSIGYFYLQKGEPKKAIPKFQEALKRNPGDIEARKGAAYSEILSW